MTVNDALENIVDAFGGELQLEKAIAPLASLVLSETARCALLHQMRAALRSA